MQEETRFLAVRELAQQLDVIIDSQQRLAVQDIPTDDRQDTMLRQDQLIRGYMKLSRKIDPSIALALYIQNKLWEGHTDVDTLWKEQPWCSSEEFDYSFQQYACTRVGREWVTIANWLTTIEVHFIGNYAPEEVILIDPRSGQPLLEQINGVTTPIVKRWDPYKVDFSKLLIVNKVAREGRLGDKGYGLLANEKTRWSDIRDYIHGLMPWREREVKEGELKFFVQNGLLWVGDGARSEIMASLEIDSNDLLVRQGIAKLVRTLGVTIR